MPPAAREDDTVWLNDDDVLDDEDTPTTLRVPHYASVAIGEAVSPLPLSMPPEISVTDDPPRRRSSPLLRATTFLCAVAIVFELGWWSGSQLAPRSAPSLAATKVAPMRITLRKAPRTLAPPEEPQPQAPVEKPGPKLFGFLVPASAASAPPAVPTATATASGATKAAVYTPDDL
jgi:hypothetical protein